MEKKITLPITDEDIKNLKAGDSVLLSGSIITGRDAAHKRLYELIQKGEKLPVDIKGELIYYVGPAPAKPGYAVGPAGPTSSYRMDKYAPSLLDLGLKGMIGKGARNKEVVDAIVRNKVSLTGHYTAHNWPVSASDWPARSPDQAKVFSPLADSQ